MAKGAFIETFKKVRQESGLTILKMLATALAAITMAVVSSRLTTVVNSLILTGLVSVGSALVNEFYRTVLTVGAERTRTVVAPIIGVEGGEDRVQPQPAEEADGSTPDDAAPAPASPKSTSSETVAAATSDEGASETHLAPEGGSEVDVPEGGEGAGSQPNKWALFWYRVRHNQVIQMSLIFAVVSLITLGVSYTVAAKAGGTEINVHETHVSQSLSEEDRELLEQAAKGSEGEDKEVATTETPETPETPTDPTDSDADLEQQIQDLQAENSALQETIAGLQDALNNETSKVDSLISRVEALESQMTAPSPDVGEDG